MIKKKRFAALLLSVMMTFTCIVPVMADDLDTVTADTEQTTTEQTTEEATVDDSADKDLVVDKEGSEGDNSLLNQDELQQVAEQTGTITITLSDGKEGTSKEKVEFSCVKVANIEKGEYVLDDTYSTTGVDLNNIKNAADLEKAAAAISKISEKGTLLNTDADGRVQFSGLEVGVYLLKATDTNNYDDITPFLVSIPTWDETEGEMSYEISVIPKHNPKPEEPTSEKDAPPTNVNSPVAWYFGGAAVLVVLIVAFNVIMKSVRKKK